MSQTRKLSRNGVRVLQADFGGVSGCTSVGNPSKWTPFACFTKGKFCTTLKATDNQRPARLQILVSPSSASVAGRDLTPKPWPRGARVAVALSFDFDAESGFLVSGNESAQPFSRGEYGPRVGVPRILQMAEKHKVPLTFFIPAVDGQLHPDAVDAILTDLPFWPPQQYLWVDSGSGRRPSV